MVYFDPEDAKVFPNFADFVMRQIPLETGNTTILMAFLQAACPNYNFLEVAERMSEILQPFLQGTAPRITYSRRRREDAEFHEYDEINKVIHFSVIRASQFNERSDEAGFQKYVRACVLHELVHHVDFMMDGKFEDYEVEGGTKRLRDGAKERGTVFENLAFGGKVTITGMANPE